MNIYERFGVDPIINVSGTKTRLGGALMEAEALEAMNEAAKYSVNLDELHAAASRIIAEKTHAEAGLVTNGAYAGMMLGIAACICGFDVARMNRLPDTDGIPNEVVMPWHQISGYDSAFRAAGGKIIGAGIPNDTTPPHEVHIISQSDIESAITEKSVAIAYAFREGAHPSLSSTIEVGKKYNISVLIDAAAQVPKLENLHRFIDMGADLVCFSGGKGIRGPQTSGILCGRRDLVGSAALQMLDMAGETFESWNPPPTLIPKEKLRGKPEHGIGRGMKVSKEAIVGLLVALDNLTEDRFSKKKSHLIASLKIIEARLHSIKGVALNMTEEYPDAYPMLEVKIDKDELGKSAREIAKALADGSPRIYVKDNYLHKGIFFIHSINLNEVVAQTVADRFRDTIIAG